MKITRLSFFLSFSFLFFLITLVGVVTYNLTAKAHAEIISAPELKQIYASSTRPIKILIVPGHDDEYWGTEFRGVKEADLTLELGQTLYALLKQDPRLDVSIVRDGSGEYSYTQQFADYFITNASSIQSFENGVHAAMNSSIADGSLQVVEGVPHITVNSDIAFRLYGIDKWVNDNNVDLVLHIHFNDTPDRPENNPGPYRGFVVYIPEKQYSNAPTSRVFGQALFDQLHTYYPKSILPVEDQGLVEDQDLIAIGPGNSLKAASALIEYGYIYEPQFLDPTIRNSVIDDLAFQTNIGIHNFLAATTSYAGIYGTPILPYTWSLKTITAYGVQNDPGILALQAALRSQGLYPAQDMDAFNCRMTGDFDPCTKRSLIEFQKKYHIPATGILGPLTKTKLNKLFSSTTTIY